MLPEELKERLQAFVPPPAPAGIESTDDVPAAFDLPWRRYDQKLEKQISGVEQVTIHKRETETSALHDLIPLLRLADAGQLPVSEKTSLPSVAAVKTAGRVLLGGDFYEEEGGEMHEREKPGPIKAFSWSLYISERQYGSLGYSGSHEWSILQGRYVLCILFEYAAAFGLIDLAYIPPAGLRNDYRKLWGTDNLSFLSRYDGLLYFRLNPLGAYCLEVADSYTPKALEVRQVFRVLPHREVIAMGEPLSAADRLTLITYLAVPRRHEKSFRRTLRELGYPLPPRLAAEEDSLGGC
ncbi:MAG: hypothetical protein HY717_06750 [Planctomycetes bacterium]|nr:hypothetical protein [Planctomycetota bacterium]